MASEDRTEAERLTCELIHRFYDGDGAWVREAMLPDSLSIGAQADQYELTVDDIVANADAMPSVVFASESYRQVYGDDAVSVVMAEFGVYTAPGQELALADTQRMSVVWVATDEGPKVQHWHVSNPMRLAREGERFPGAAGHEAFRAMALMAEQQRYRSVVNVQDTSGVIHQFKLYDVVYVEASRHNVVIHLSDGSECVIHQGIGELARQARLHAEGGFVQVHRSYWVNALYVRSVDAEVELTNGVRLPVPERRRVGVRARLAELRQP